MLLHHILLSCYDICILYYIFFNQNNADRVVQTHGNFIALVIELYSVAMKCIIKQANIYLERLWIQNWFQLIVLL